MLKLERRGLELGILSGSLATPMNELAELIFYPGLSTADSLTEVSGRGIGIDAVKSFVEEAGGSIRVQIDPTQARLDYCSFALLISLPSTLYIRRNGADANSIPAGIQRDEPGNDGAEYVLGTTDHRGCQCGI